MSTENAQTSTNIALTDKKKLRFSTEKSLKRGEIACFARPLAKCCRCSSLCMRRKKIWRFLSLKCHQRAKQMAAPIWANAYFWKYLGRTCVSASCLATPMRSESISQPNSADNIRVLTWGVVLHQQHTWRQLVTLFGLDCFAWIFFLFATQKCCHLQPAHVQSKLSWLCLVCPTTLMLFALNFKLGCAARKSCISSATRDGSFKKLN